MGECKPILSGRSGYADCAGEAAQRVRPQTASGLVRTDSDARSDESIGNVLNGRVLGIRGPSHRDDVKATPALRRPMSPAKRIRQSNNLLLLAIVDGLGRVAS